MRIHQRNPPQQSQSWTPQVQSQIRASKLIGEIKMKSSGMDEVKFAGAATKLLPVAVLQSSIFHCRSVDCGSFKCIDGLTNDDLCHTNAEPAPWLALDFGEEAQVSVGKTVLLNRKDQSWDRTRNVELWLTDKIPTTATKAFSGGHMLGTFEGPASSGQEVEIESGPGWKEKMGRYLIIQINNGTEPKHFLHFREVFAFGITHVPSNGMFRGS